MSGEEVANLEEALFRDSGATDIVRGTGYYNDSLASAVSGFQVKYSNEILVPAGLKNPTGYFGTLSRKKMNSLYGCGSSNQKVPATFVPYISVLYPNGGETLYNGDGKDSNLIANIQWSTANFGDLLVSIDLINPQGYIVKNIAQGIPNTGNYPWKSDRSLSTGTYKILVSSFDKGPSAQDYSNNHFRLSTSFSDGVPVTPLSIISSYPPNGAIDARVSSENMWRSVTLTFDGLASNLTTANFSTESTLAVNPPKVVDVNQKSVASNNQVNIIFDRPIMRDETVAVAYVRPDANYHNIESFATCLSSLPGDVDQSRMVAPADLLAMIDVINGVKTAPLYAADLDGSGVINTADHLKMIDLINAGTGAKVPNCEQ